MSLTPAPNDCIIGKTSTIKTPSNRTDPKEEMKRLYTLYKEAPETKAFRALVYGDSGTGKTYSLHTARLPLLVDSFDPGGSKVLESLVASGNAFIDSRWEKETPRAPWVWAKWAAEFDKRMKNGTFNMFGTYVLDSATTWAMCALYDVLLEARRPMSTPQQNDWYPQMRRMEMAFSSILSLPCDVIVIAHQASDKDEVTGRMYGAPMFTGKLAARVPILFDEMYHMEVGKDAKGTPTYNFRTKPDATWKAKSRLSSIAAKYTNAIAEVAPANFKEILKKCKYPHEDKEPLNFLLENGDEDKEIHSDTQGQEAHMD